MTDSNKNAGPYSIGSPHWPGLSKLLEELGEVAQVAGKLLGAGGAVEHWDGSNLRDRLHEELADAMAAIRFFVDTNGLDGDRILARAEKKYELFVKWHGQPVALPASSAVVAYHCTFCKRGERSVKRLYREGSVCCCNECAERMHALNVQDGIAPPSATATQHGVDVEDDRV